MAKVFHLRFDAGATFTRGFGYTNDDDTVFNLTGYTAQMQIRETVNSPVALEVYPDINVATGEITLNMTAAETSTLTNTNYVYAIELHGPADSPVIRLVQGQVIVSPEVVRG